MNTILKLSVFIQNSVNKESKQSMTDI